MGITKVLKYSTALIFLLFISSCGGESTSSAIEKKAEEPGQAASPKLNYEELQINDCISLQKLQKTIARKGFNFPGQLATTDFESDKKDPRFHIYNFGSRDIQFQEIPFIGEIRQDNCETLTMKSAHGRELVYNIVDSSPRFLRLTLAKNQDPQEESDLDDEHLKAFDVEPQFTAIEVRLSDPQKLLLNIEASAIFPQCNPEKKIPYKKSMQIEWARQREDGSTTVPVSVSFMNYILSLKQSVSSEELPAQPLPITPFIIVPHSNPATSSEVNVETVTEESHDPEFQSILRAELISLREQLLGHSWEKTCR